MSREASYVDEKGRTRWRCNDAIGEKLKDLHDHLVISGYEPSHAARYPKLAYAISRHPESIEDLHREGRLSEIPGVGPTIVGILSELIEQGETAKGKVESEEFAPAPRSVLELTKIPGLGALLARRLYADYGVKSLAELQKALEEGHLDSVPGLGPKMREKIRQAVP